MQRIASHCKTTGAMQHPKSTLQSNHKLVCSIQKMKNTKPKAENWFPVGHLCSLIMSSAVNKFYFIYLDT